MTIYCSPACLRIIRIPLFILFVGKIEGVSACCKFPAGQSVVTGVTGEVEWPRVCTEQIRPAGHSENGAFLLNLPSHP